MRELRERAAKLLRDGMVQRVLGWKRGDLPWNPEPAFFETEESLHELVCDGFCGANLSKYMIEASLLEGKTLVFLKPCDTYSFNQLQKEHRVRRESAYIIGIGCGGKLDPEKIRAMGIRGIRSIQGAQQNDPDAVLTFDTLYGEKSCSWRDALLERCRVCRKKEPADTAAQSGTVFSVWDEQIGESRETCDRDRFAQVEQLEVMTSPERLAFWQQELGRCIRCNACRNVCPACSCRTCVFDGGQFDSASKANADSFGEKLFHVIRAFHVAGRCTDCGECSRVCPQGIPLHLLNRKLIRDINGLYGEYQAGQDPAVKAPLTDYAEDDAEPGAAGRRGSHV